MEATIIAQGLAAFLHDLFTVVWIGGLFNLAVVVLPSARKLRSSRRDADGKGAGGTDARRPDPEGTGAARPDAGASSGGDAGASALVNGIQKRLRPLVAISIVGLLVTGVSLSRSSGEFEGLFSFSNAFSTMLAIKHVLVALMILTAARTRLMIRRRRSGGAPAAPAVTKAADGTGVVLLYINLGLGVGVLLLSGISAALS